MASSNIENSTHSNNKRYSLSEKQLLLVWLDLNANTEANMEIQRNLLRNLSNITLKVFEKQRQCELFMEEKYNESIILITSGSLGREMIPRLHGLKQLHEAYIFCYDRSANEKWAKDYSKIQRVVTTPDELLQHLSTSVSNYHGTKPR
ncbi:unnamed protein product, partial [Didymodactylos carnosus]